MARSERPCPHGMPSFWSCGECVYGDKPPPETSNPAQVTREATFLARYDGHCDGCNLPIYVGQKIARMSDDRYLHDLCTA